MNATTLCTCRHARYKHAHSMKVVGGKVWERPERTFSRCIITGCGCRKFSKAPNLTPQRTPKAKTLDKTEPRLW